MRSSRTRRRPTVTVLAAVAVVTVTLAACDTGDGRTLEPPTSYQRWRLASTAPTTTAALREESQFPPVLPAEDVTADPFDTGAPATERAGGLDPDAGGVGLALVDLEAPWADGEVIDAIFTCDGDHLTPFVTWTHPGDEAVELALVVTSDESVPPLGAGGAADTDHHADIDQHRDTVGLGRRDDAQFVHWTVIALPPVAGGIGDETPIEGGIEGRNSAGTFGWLGPCPPGDTEATYHVTLHYLDQQLEMPADADATDLLAAIRAATVAEVSLSGSYSSSLATGTS